MILQKFIMTLQAFYDLGARYIQLDDVYWAGLTDGTQK